MTPIEHGNYYHIFNRGNNYENIFRQKSDYQYFLKLMKIYVVNIADVYAWALLQNHFHLLLRIKKDNEIGFLNSKYANSDDLELKWRTYFPDYLSSEGHRNVNDSSDNSTILSPAEESMSLYSRKPEPAQNLKHFFNTYAKGYNKKYNRDGSLFIKNFKRIHVDNENYLKNVIVYIHQNPVHHGFTEQIDEYPWTSYLTVLSDKTTNLRRETVLGFFEDHINYRYLHQKTEEFKLIEGFIIE